MADRYGFSYWIVLTSPFGKPLDVWRKWEHNSLISCAGGRLLVLFSNGLAIFFGLRLDALVEHEAAIDALFLYECCLW